MDPHPRYQLLEKLGSGSYATVYRARDLELNREVAVKQLHEQYLQDPQQLERYWAEAQLLASFPHPNIVTIFDIVRERGWLILDLMQGSLAKIAGRKAMDLAALKATIAHCLRALKFLHEHGVVHGDVKPGNMMIDRRKRVKLGDFGLARRVSDAEGSLIKGTTKYMAPEVVSEEFGTVGPASDLYSLGFAAFELMCGENFESLFPGLNAFGRDKQMAWMMWHAAPDRRLPEIRRVLEGVPEDLATCIEKLTAKSQAQRYKSADEALSDLNVDIKLVKTGEDGEPKPEPVSEDVKRRRLIIGMFSASMVLSLLMLFPWSKGKGPVVDKIPGVAGVVREISMSPPQIVVDDAEGHPTPVNVGDKPRIQLDYNTYILLKDLHKGDRVEIHTVEASDGTREVNINALRPEHSRGAISSINPQDQTLYVVVGEGLSNVPLQVNKGSKLTLNSRPTVLADLRIDDRVDVMHLKNSAAVAARQVTILNAFRTTQLVGFVKVVDQARKYLTVEQPGGRDEQLATREIADNCTFTLNGQTQVDGKPVTLGDIQENDRVTLRLDSKITEVAAIRKPRLTGVIMKVSENPGSVLVRTKDGQDTLFQVEGTTDIELSRAPAALGELREYDNVDVTYEPKGDGRLAKSLDVARPIKTDRIAILISINNYKDKNLSQLSTPRSDAQLIRESFIRRYAFGPEKILFLADQDKSAVLAGLNEWLRKSDNYTQIWVYFAGNAYRGDQGTVYLAAADTRLDNLAGTGIKLESLIEMLEGTVARDKLLLLDASYSGDAPDRRGQPSTAEMVESVQLASGRSPLKTLSIITSCKKGEAGQIWRDKEHGLFAWYVADALTGRADKNPDLMITPRELYDYLNTVMTTPAKPGQPVQTPSLFP